jgi:hypothetical protein
MKNLIIYIISFIIILILYKCADYKIHVRSNIKIEKTNDKDTVIIYDTIKCK